MKNLDEKMQKSTYFLIEIQTNCQKMPKFPGFYEFFDLVPDCLVWTFDVETKSRNLNLGQDFLTVETNFLKMSSFSRLSRQIETPKLRKNGKIEL